MLTALVAVDWQPPLTVDGTLSRTTHRWAVHDRALTQAFRRLTDWAWDPLTMGLVRAAVAVRPARPPGGRRCGRRPPCPWRRSCGRR
ncbi:hypothetical protein ACWDBD_15545 [Streptomyces sp. NPDC001118]